MEMTDEEIVTQLSALEWWCPSCQAFHIRNVKVQGGRHWYEPGWEALT